MSLTTLWKNHENMSCDKDQVGKFALELRCCHYLAAVVEHNADAAVAQKVAETVLLTIIDPLCDPMRWAYQGVIKG